MHYANAAHLKAPENGVGCPRDQAAIVRVQNHAIISNQARKSWRGMGQERQREVRFARARRATQQQANPVNHKGRGVDRLAHVAGRRTIKRAPEIVPSPRLRFSARIVPPWARTICREMESPRPELLPKALWGLSV